MGKSGRNGALGQLVLGYDENIELEITPMSSFSRETLTKLGWKYDPKTQKPYHWDLVVALQSAYEHAFLHYHRGNFTTLFAGMADTAGRRLNLNTNVLIH